MTDFNRIAASAPVNKQAAMQTSGGETWSPKVALQDYFEDMPRTKRIPSHHKVSSEFVDFTGQQFGRLKVIGLMEKKVSSHKASWVCRCSCGGYCTRTSKSLKVAARAGNSFLDRCGRCQYVDGLRNGWTPGGPVLRDGSRRAEVAS